MKPSVESDFKKVKRRFISFFEFLDQEEEKDGFFYYLPEGDRAEYDFDSDPNKVTKKVVSSSGNKLQVDEFSSAKDLLIELFAMIEKRLGTKIEAQTLDDSILNLEQLNMSFLEKKELAEENSTTDRVIAEESSLSKEKQLELNKKLFDAASKKGTSLEYIQELYDQGAQVNASFPDSHDKRWSQSALNQAVECGNYEVAEFLLQKHADPNVPKNLSFAVFNPLQLAVGKGDFKFVELLLKNGADYSQKGRLDMDPLEFMLLIYSAEDSQERKDNVKRCLDLFKENHADIEQAADNIIKEGFLSEKEKEDLLELVAPYSKEKEEEKEIDGNSLPENSSLKGIIETLKSSHLKESPKDTKRAPITPPTIKSTPANSR
jgi:hypothetical protein